MLNKCWPSLLLMTAEGVYSIAHAGSFRIWVPEQLSWDENLYSTGEGIGAQAVGR